MEDPRNREKYPCRSRRNRNHCLGGRDLPCDHKQRFVNYLSDDIRFVSSFFQQHDYTYYFFFVAFFSDVIFQRDVGTL